MLKTPAVAVAAIIAGTVLGLGLLGVVGWLLFADKDTAAILTLVNTILASASLAKTYAVASKADRIADQTNGHTTRLMDAALKDKEQS